jgi:hypothetical protein
VVGMSSAPIRRRWTWLRLQACHDVSAKSNTTAATVVTSTQHLSVRSWARSPGVAASVCGPTLADFADVLKDDAVAERA